MGYQDTPHVVPRLPEINQQFIQPCLTFPVGCLERDDTERIGCADVHGIERPDKRSATVRIRHDESGKIQPGYIECLAGCDSG